MPPGRHAVVWTPSILILAYFAPNIEVDTLHHRDDPQRQMTDAEVLTTAIVVAFYHGGCVERARALLDSPRYMPHMLSKSRFNRRLHAIADLDGCDSIKTHHLAEALQYRPRRQGP